MGLGVSFSLLEYPGAAQQGLDQGEVGEVPRIHTGARTLRDPSSPLPEPHTPLVLALRSRCVSSQLSLRGAALGLFGKHLWGEREGSGRWESGTPSPPPATSIEHLANTLISALNPEPAWTSDLQKQENRKVVLYDATKRVAICYSHNQK